jgi:hypothetical protein
MSAIDTSNDVETIDESLLYVPVQQLDTIPDWGPEYVKVTPEIARKWLAESGEDENFRNRKLSVPEMRRFAYLMRTKRFVHWLPDGPICFDEFGILINGKTRLTAIDESGVTCGFMVFRGVPRWMFPFMGIGKSKNVGQVFYAELKESSSAFTSVMKTVLRYEEFLSGKRGRYGWKNWKGKWDQPSDLTLVYERRKELAGYYGNAMLIRNGRNRAGCKLLAVSLMIFQMYQWYAWPEGRPKLEEFLDSLTDGSGFKKGSANLSLYNFGRHDYCEPAGRQYAHLILLFRHFGAYATGKNITTATIAFGHEMLPPFHPDGPEAAKENLRKALIPLDAPLDTPVPTPAG